MCWKIDRHRRVDVTSQSLGTQDCHLTIEIRGRDSRCHSTVKYKNKDRLVGGGSVALFNSSCFQVQGVEL